MSWNHLRAKDRIRDLINGSPSVITEQFGESFGRLVEARTSKGLVSPTANETLISIPRNRAIVVDGAHIYAKLVNYEDFLSDTETGSEDSFKRSLAFLHLHYAATDYLLEEFGALRVDFHFGRMHCVIVDPDGDRRAMATQAIELAHRLREFTNYANERFAEGKYRPKVRVGIDIGRCVAINNGIGLEQEPLFLGSAANYAAKLADGEIEGVFLSANVRAALRLPASVDDERTIFDRQSSRRMLEEASAQGFGLSVSLLNEVEQFSRLETKWRSDLAAKLAVKGGKSAFQFHAHVPPLNTIDFSNLSPANSILMPVASIFADIDGYTAFIDQCISENCISDAVKALHVARGEFSNVLQDDFGARKVRYIGDCVHGLLAAGTAHVVDPKETARDAVRCGAAMRESFNLVKDELGTIDSLGLAVGIDYGQTPISRIGIRGVRSVRAAASKASTQSEALQRGCDGCSMAIGTELSKNLPISVSNIFANGVLRNGSYDMIEIALRGSPVITETKEEFRPHCQR